MADTQEPEDVKSPQTPEPKPDDDGKDEKPSGRSSKKK